MPVSKAARISQAEHNEALFSLLQKHTGQYSDWQATVLFYAALHYVCAYIDSLGTLASDVRDHKSRSRFMARESQLTFIYGEYENLRSWSQQTRYLHVRPTETDLQKLYADSFSAVRTHMRALLKV